ncbi:hypothetical protein TNCV_739331 [Trichonephila clavipes]|nr:hypothetical protein TNCV_739331 [Trichonephila clavipes]
MNFLFYHEFLKEDDLNELVTVYDNKEVNAGEIEGEVQLLTADLFRQGIKFATSVIQVPRRCLWVFRTPRISFAPRRNNPDRKGLAIGEANALDLHGQSIVHHMLHPSDSEQKY